MPPYNFFIAYNFLRHELRPRRTRPDMTKTWGWDSYLRFSFKPNFEIITSICRMNNSFYYKLSIRAYLIGRAEQAFLVLTRRLDQCNREWATGCMYVYRLLRYRYSYWWLRSQPTEAACSCIQTIFSLEIWSK